MAKQATDHAWGSERRPLTSFSMSSIVAKNLDNCDVAQTSNLDLRPLTNELGGRLDYGQPFCCFHSSCRCISKALTALRSLQARSSSSPRRRSLLMAELRS